MNSADTKVGFQKCLHQVILNPEEVQLTDQDLLIPDTKLKHMQIHILNITLSIRKSPNHSKTITKRIEGTEL